MEDIKYKAVIGFRLDDGRIVAANSTVVKSALSVKEFNSLVNNKLILPSNKGFKTAVIAIKKEMKKLKKAL